MTSRPLGQQIPCVLRNMTVNFRLHERPLQVSALSHSNTDHHTFTQSTLILSFRQRLRPFYFFNMLCELTYSIFTKFPAHFIL